VEPVVAVVADRLDAAGRTGDARLAGVLAAVLHRAPRARIVARSAGPLGMPLARRVADLVGLHPYLQRPFPDEGRRAGLVRMAVAADLGVLHALAGAAAGDAQARERVEWSALYAEEAGLLGTDPLGPLREGLREALGDLGPDAADRCWAEAREAFGRGGISTAGEAVAATWRWRDGSFPRLVQLCGPSGSGKSTYARSLPGVAAYVSLDELRTARGSRSDQRANADVLREGLDRLDAALAAAAGTGGTVVWDATCLTEQQRGMAGAVARRRDALVTQVVVLVEEAELVRRNAVRPHPVPAEVLTTQLHRFSPPYPGQGAAHRIRYVGAGGTVEDTAGTIGAAAQAPPPPAAVGATAGATVGATVGEDG
ncbi:AAA family ATPase, partial [Streptomyces sp. NPDC056519]|uniref:AAA family ATPase n=1 Tax=Streptomyces sp. NPDC056519 TaxID=3345849 RepID=UPI0036989B56